jgi:hypothetical protein
MRAYLVAAAARVSTERRSVHHSRFEARTQPGIPVGGIGLGKAAFERGLGVGVHGS